jgi:hypothetical protein
MRVPENGLRRARQGAFLAGVGVLALGAVSAKTARIPEKARAKVTFAKDVASIIYKNCATCHHPGEVAPFSLVTYDEVKKHAKQIAAVTKNRFMPPWKADSHGEFVNERRLTEQEIATLDTWAAGGTPMGDASAIPPPPKFPQGWRIGKPDQIISMPEKYSVEAEGRDVYRCFVVPTNYGEDKFISALEFHPGNRALVHHVIAYLDTTGAARKLDEKDPGSGYTSSGGGVGFLPTAMLGGWAPGNDPETLPDGIGILLPRGGDIVLEVHYHKTGKPETDLTQVGVKYASKPVDKRLRLMVVTNFAINIPPGESNYILKGTTPIGADVTVLGVTPHMHLLGREMTVTAETPDGKSRQMVKVPDWDFNWQIPYAFKEPVKLPAGSKLSLVARYDNSSANPHNPSNPPKRVTFGEQTTNEMCFAFVGFTVDSEVLTKGIKAKKVTPYELGN